MELLPLLLLLLLLLLLVLLLILLLLPLLLLSILLLPLRLPWSGEHEYSGERSQFSQGRGILVVADANQRPGQGRHTTTALRSLAYEVENHIHNGSTVCI